jgi:hypothetical protein
LEIELVIEAWHSLFEPLLNDPFAGTFGQTTANGKIRLNLKDFSPLYD